MPVESDWQLRAKSKTHENAAQHNIHSWQSQPNCDCDCLLAWSPCQQTELTLRNLEPGSCHANGCMADTQGQPSMSLVQHGAHCRSQQEAPVPDHAKSTLFRIKHELVTSSQLGLERCCQAVSWHTRLQCTQNTLTRRIMIMCYKRKRGKANSWHLMPALLRW